LSARARRRPTWFHPDIPAKSPGNGAITGKPGKANLTGIKAVKEMVYMMLELARSPVRSVSASFKEAL
jgi:hypothetical protein